MKYVSCTSKGEINFPKVGSNFGQSMKDLKPFQAEKVKNRLQQQLVSTID